MKKIFSQCGLLYCSVYWIFCHAQVFNLMKSNLLLFYFLIFICLKKKSLLPGIIKCYPIFFLEKFKGLFFTLNI